VSMPRRYGRSARGSPEPSPAAPRQHDSPFLRSLSLVAYAYKFTEVYATRRSHAGPQAPLVRPRASRPPLDFMALLTCESTMNDNSSLAMRLRGEH
jgi:hypothetical protein